MSVLRKISSASARLGRWPIALAACFVLALVVLLPRLGATGLWEPQERMFADRVALPQDVDAERAARQLLQSAQTIGELARPQPDKKPAPAAETCDRTPPKDAVARSLTTRAVRAGRDGVSDDDFGRRLPLALLGLVTVLAAAGIAMRLAGARAGLVAAMVLLSMPLLVLQSRMLTSELGTACGGALIMYGLVAFARPYRGRGFVRLGLDALGSAMALASGVAIGFFGGGALLGLAVPIGAFAAAGSLGAPAVIAAIRRRPVAEHVPALIATLAVAALLALLAWQLYDVRDPHPGIVPQARQVLGQAVIPEGCWSWALGGIWRPEDDLRFIYDSSFEQIAYGTFPWGVLAPIAMAALLRDGDGNRRLAGAVALAWAGAAWIATEAFQRKVGFTIWAGFPALAVAVGVWVDGVIARRDRGDDQAMPAGALLVGLFFLLAAVDLGKDMYSFAEKVTSLLAGGDTVQYPKPSKLLFLPTRLWPLVLGGVVALGFATTMMAWRPGDEPAARLGRRIAAWAAAVALAATCAAAAFWAFAWHPELGNYLSSKTIFETYRDLRAPADDLVIMGDLGQAPRAYADACQEPPAPSGVAPPVPPAPTCTEYRLLPVQSRDQIVTALKQDKRVFAIAPQSELCALHREIGDKPYFVLEERNLRNLLLSNKVDGATDKNPLSEMIVHKPPEGIPSKPPKRIVFDNKIEVLGWDLPERVGRGETFDIVLYYKILAPVGANWKSLMHFDGNAGRAGNADHEPINARCQTSTWQQGDYIIDRFRGAAGSGAYPKGKIEVWIGFFTGSAPSFRNMTLSEAPEDQRDKMDRVRISSFVLD